jgi:hypothetical protein
MAGFTQKFVSVILAVISVLTMAQIAHAATTPNFPTCIAPSGSVKANYDNGTHGIVGDTNTYTGKDTVYTISDNALTQCFCPGNGAGIQTNWVKAGIFSENDQKVLIAQGWIYIPTGKVWGLEDVAYLAKNESFSCRGTDSKVAGASATNSHKNEAGNVLSLASTGNFSFLLGTFILSIIFLAGGIILRRDH